VEMRVGNKGVFIPGSNPNSSSPIGLRVGLLEFFFDGTSIRKSVGTFADDTPIAGISGKKRHSGTHIVESNPQKKNRSQEVYEMS